MTALSLDKQSLARLEQHTIPFHTIPYSLREKICSVCVDRNPDGSCDRLAERSCTLMAKLPLAAEAICQVDSPSIGPYIESIRRNVCEKCELRNMDGTCDLRHTDHCMLNSYLPFVVEVVEDHLRIKQR